MKDDDKHIDHRKQGPATLHRMTGSLLKQAYIKADHRSAGLDHWTPNEFSLLSDKAFNYLAEMLNTIEDGADWPTQLLLARAAFL